MVREIRRAKLFGVVPATFSLYPSTDAATRDVISEAATRARAWSLPTVGVGARFSAFSPEPFRLIGFIPWNSRSTWIPDRYHSRDGCYEYLAPHCFDTSGDIVALYSHNDRLPLGSTRYGTLKLRDSGSGLHVEITPPADEAWALQVMERVCSGLVGHMSFRFTPLRTEETAAGAVVVRRARLTEVSVLRRPAYRSSWVALETGDPIAFLHSRLDRLAA